MMKLRPGITAVLVVLFFASLITSAAAQNSVTVLAGADLARVVPPGFYFQGLTAPTQMRNAAAARFGRERYVIVGMVDTAGYAADVRAKYEGFFITDSPVRINGKKLDTGAYGFGFTNDGKLNILDLGGKEILSVSTTRDTELKRPRPLMMTKSGDDVRFYSGKDYVTITAG
jgi:hypothetical protein